MSTNRNARLGVLVENILLLRDHALCILNGEGLLVRVRHGSVWITQDADLEDHILNSEDGFRLDRPGLALVRALSAAQITLKLDRSQPRPASGMWPFAKRIWAKLTGESTRLAGSPSLAMVHWSPPELLGGWSRRKAPWGKTHALLLSHSRWRILPTSPCQSGVA